MKITHREAFLVSIALWNGFFWAAVVIEVGQIPWRIGMIVLTVAVILSAVLPLFARE